MSRLLPYQVSLETDRPNFPGQCICCMRSAETEYLPTPPPRARGLPEPDRPLRLPYCHMCLEHFHHWQHSGANNMLLANIAIWGVALPLLADMPPLTMAAGPTLALLLLYRTRTKKKPKISDDCTTQGAAFRAIWHRRSTYIFSFTNERFAKQFRELNADSQTP